MLARIMSYCIALPVWFNCHNFNNYINLVSRSKLIWFSRFLTSLPIVPPSSHKPANIFIKLSTFFNWLVTDCTYQWPTAGKNKHKRNFSTSFLALSSSLIITIIGYRYNYHLASRLVGSDSYRYTFCILHIVLSCLFFACEIFWYIHAMSNDKIKINSILIISNIYYFFVLVVLKYLFLAIFKYLIHLLCVCVI